MTDYLTPSARLRALDRRRPRGRWLVALLVAITVLVLAVLMPSLDAWGAVPYRLEHYHGVREDGALRNCWNVYDSPLTHFCAFYLIGALDRR